MTNETLHSRYAPEGCDPRIVVGAVAAPRVAVALLR
jgi:hypothetical protein